MSKWISISDELPNIGEYVLLFANNIYSNNHIFLGHIGSFDGRMVTGSPSVEIIGCTHWMPLPESPEEK